MPIILFPVTIRAHYSVENHSIVAIAPTINDVSLALWDIS